MKISKNEKKTEWIKRNNKIKNKNKIKYKHKIEKKNDNKILKKTYRGTKFPLKKKLKTKTRIKKWK